MKISWIHLRQLTGSGFRTLWQKLMDKVVEQGIERFTFHDLKSKGVSDSSGRDKQQDSGHRSAAIVAVYGRKLAEVKPAGE